MERDRQVIHQLQHSLESERTSGRDLDDLTVQLEAERAAVVDVRAAFLREQKVREDTEGERNLLKQHLGQERGLNEQLKHDLDRLQVGTVQS